MTVSRDFSQIQFTNYLVDSWNPPEAFGTLPPDAAVDQPDDSKGASRRTRQNVLPEASILWSASNLSTKSSLPTPSPDQPQRVAFAEEFRNSRKYRYGVGGKTPPFTMEVILGNADEADNIDAMDINSDGTVCAVTFSDSRTLVWSLSGSQTVAEEKTFANLYHTLFPSSTDGPTRCVLPTSRGTSVLRLAPDAPVLLTGSTRGELCLWSIETGCKLVTYIGHSTRTPVWSIDWSPAGYYFATGSGDSTARVWRTDVPFPIRNFNVNGSQHVQVVKWHPSCQLLALGASNSLSIVDATGTADDHNSEVFRFDTFANTATISFSPTGFLVAAANDKMLCIWELNNGSCIFQFETFNRIMCLSWSYPMASGLGDGGLKSVTGTSGSGHPVLASVEDGGKVRIWDKLYIPKSSVCELAPEKSVRPLHMHFSHRNLLIIGGASERGDVSSIESQLGYT
jgi:transcription initiation factor TFIID subunit 5